MVQRKSFIFLVLTKKQSETEMYLSCNHHVQRCLTFCSIICLAQVAVDAIDAKVQTRSFCSSCILFLEVLTFSFCKTLNLQDVLLVFPLPQV